MEYIANILGIFKSLGYFIDINAGLTGVKNGSTDWGDYDNDGDLDLLITGATATGSSSKIYNNTNGIFTDINAGLEDVDNGTAVWGDYDNDGDLDIALAGHSLTGDVGIIYRNDAGIFNDINAELYDGELVSWGDYDNDGNLDLLLTFDSGDGSYLILYSNNAGIFTKTYEYESIVRGSSEWGDYDNDGDLDILIVGGYLPDGEDPNPEPYTKIYTNNAGVFSVSTMGLPQLTSGSAEFGDYDNDGDLDIIISGGYESESYEWIGVTKIYNNDSGVFTDINAGLAEVSYGSVAWGDYDNDGDLDVLATGRCFDSEEKVNSKSYYSTTNLYRNDSEIFTSVYTNFSDLEESSVAWGDYDNDGDLDILLTGYYSYIEGEKNNDPITEIYRNNLLISNTIPVAPENLSSIANGSEVALSWDKATDNETPQDGLSYNLYLGMTDQKDSVASSMSDISNGYRKIVAMGNANQNNSWTIKDLEGGTYYWSVQSVDHTFAGSEFSAEQSFAILGIPENINIIYSETEAQITWDPIPEANSYKVFASTDPYGDYSDFSNFGTFDGESWSIDWSGNKLFFYVVSSTETAKKIPVQNIRIRGVK